MISLHKFDFSLLNKTAYFLLFVLGSFFSSTAFAQEPPANTKVDGLYIDAVKARMIGDDKQEEQLLLQVIKLNPSAAAAYYDLSRVYLKKTDASKAEKMITQAVKLDEANPWYQQQYAEVLVYQNKFGAAADILKKLADDDVNSQLLFKAAMLYQKAGDNKQSLAMLDKLEQHNKNDEDILIAKQQIYLKMNDVDGAVNVAKQLIASNPGDGKYYSNLADIYDNNNQPDKALAVYQKALKDFPEEPTLQYGIASYYKKVKDVAMYDKYMRLTILNPGFDDETQTVILRTYLDEISRDSLRKPKGEDLAQQLATMHPDNPQVVSLYGQVLSRNGENEKAAVQFKKALDADPARFNIWQELLQVYLNVNDADSLIVYSKKAMRYFPNQAIVHYLNGAGYFNKKEYTEAVKSYNRAIALQPDDNILLLADMYSSLGDAFNSLKEYHHADSSYEKSLRLNSNNASVLNNYSYYLSLRGERLDDAERMSKRSLELRPDEATFLDTYAWVLYKKGEYAKAKEWMEKAMKANPNADGTMWEHLGDICFKLGNIEKAVAHWKQAKQKGLDSKLIDKKIQDKKLYE